MMGYFWLMKGEASLARNGWFATILATGWVEENHRLETHEFCFNQSILDPSVVPKIECTNTLGRVLALRKH